MRYRVISTRSIHYNVVLLNKLILANLAHRPVRTILSVLAIAVEVTMILTLVGVSNGTLHESARRARGTGADILVRPPGSSALSSLSSAPMSDHLPAILMNEPHVTLATGTMVQPLELFDTITGLDMDQFGKMKSDRRRAVRKRKASASGKHPESNHA